MLASVGTIEWQPRSRLSHIIHSERRWFESAAINTDEPRITVSRWIGHAPKPHEQQAEIEADCHVVGIALEPITDVTLFAAGRLISTGRLPRGTTRVSEPGLTWRGIFSGEYDVLHLHVPNVLLAEYASFRGAQAQPVPSIRECSILDPVITRLAASLIQVAQTGGALGPSYADGLSLAITAQIFGRKTQGAPDRRLRASGLAKWRLKRVTDYMEANLAEPISLGDMAAAAGLSRMHFAAQFRAAIGQRPHEYLLQRRIQRAQDLLLHSPLSLVEIALDVGFKTQAHFTSVFGRFVAETPNAWRRRNRSL